MAKDKLSDAQRRAVDWIKNGSARELGALGTEVGKMLAELTAELMDAKQEAAHYKASLNTVIDEFTVAMATVLAGGGERGTTTEGEPRIAIRKKDFGRAVGLQLFTEQPDKDTRLYTLRKKPREDTKIDQAVHRGLIATH